MSDEPFYKLNPQSSVTAYEVAQILAAMEIEISLPVLEKLDKNTRRHFHLVVKDDDQN